MAKLPESPPLQRLAEIAPDIHILHAGSELWRIYARGGAYPRAWNTFRAYGPVADMRFDHHTEPAREQERRILYGASRIPICVAEFFQRDRTIDRSRDDPWLVGFTVVRDAILLDLRGTWPTRAGASMAINTGRHDRARRWSRAIYEAYLHRRYRSAAVLRYTAATRRVSMAAARSWPWTVAASVQGGVTMSDQRAPLIPDGGLSRREFLRLTGLGAAAVAAGSPVLAQAATRAGAPARSPQHGGALRLGNTADVVSFQPYSVSDNVSIWTMLLLYDQLTRPTTDGLNIEPSLAASWNIAPDNKTYTFHLRPGVRFHDGSPLTAEDVKYCLEQTIASPGGSYFFSAVKGVAIPDQRTVVIHLQHPHAPFLSDMALYDVSIYPKKLAEQMGKGFWQHPIGTGPFMFSSWRRGSEIVMARNPHFWRPGGMPYVDTFHNLVVPEANTRVLQVQSGELDIALFPPPALAKSLQGNPAVSVHVDNFMDSHFVTLNVSRPPLNNKLVRQALNYAVDKDAIVKHVLFGFGQPSGQALPVMFGYDPSVQPYPYDPKKAKQMLAQAGYPHGFALKMIVDASVDTDKEIATLMQQELGQIGVKISIEILEETTFYNLKMNPPHNYQLSPDYMTSDIIDPDELVSYAVAGDAGNDAVWTMYNNKTVNALARQGKETFDRAARQKLYYELDRLHHDDAPMIFLYHAPSVSLTSSAVQGFKVLPTGNYRLEEVWLQK